MRFVIDLPSDAQVRPAKYVTGDLEIAIYSLSDMPIAVFFKPRSREDLKERFSKGSDDERAIAFPIDDQHTLMVERPGYVRP